MTGKVTLEKLRKWAAIEGVGIILSPNASFISIADLQTALVSVA
jgi:hypothetical protein